MNFCDTGHGATATLAATGLSVNIKSIDLGEETIEDITKTHLASTRKQMSPGDLPNDGEITIPFQWNESANNIRTARRGTPEASQPITITFPNGGDVGAPVQSTFTAAGYIKRVKRPNLQSNQINEGEITFMLDGSIEPTYS